MLELVNGLILYQGSYCEVKDPQLEKCARRKDFGRGFYLTSSKEQAVSFLNTSIAKAIANGSIELGQDFGYISTFEVNLKSDLAIHVFEDSDTDWLHCIAAHRKNVPLMKLKIRCLSMMLLSGKLQTMPQILL